jgi:hypothetical protein
VGSFVGSTEAEQAMRAPRGVAPRGAQKLRE